MHWKLHHALGIGIVILSLFLIFATDGFFTSYNLLNILRQISLNCFMAIGFGITLIAGGMDISMGAVAALNGVIAAYLGVPPFIQTWP